VCEAIKYLFQQRKKNQNESSAAFRNKIPGNLAVYGTILDKNMSQGSRILVKFFFLLLVITNTLGESRTYNLTLALCPSSPIGISN
jgi:hypothetical protein